MAVVTRQCVAVDARRQARVHTSTISPFVVWTNATTSSYSG
ncbi:hypothetical protein BZL30_8668 [Mycobacterium kansasii]|uniref:Uncharacterized protein n=1 Tax=Mycobacterium kansasii TaxID=1768 RepID=A0A1V3WHT7_MYCKA|nr:hypothetical protein BZL30_8668 [Mycobacterium kansasii]